MWRGVKLGADLRSRFTDSPRLAPFTPGRLRGLTILSLCCAGSTAVLVALAVLKIITAVLGVG